MTRDASAVVARPTGRVDELILLFHGVGADARSLIPFGQFLAGHRPAAQVVSVEAPFACDLGMGRQWFSVRDVTEENRPARVAQAMPEFASAVRHWQARSGVSAGGTVLIGFSQGAIMALESLQAGAPLAGRIISLAGRFARAPGRAPAGTLVHLIHGADDAVIPPGHSEQAAQALRTLGGQVTIDVLPGLGHGLDARVASRVLAHLATAAAAG